LKQPPCWRRSRLRQTTWETLSRTAIPSKILIREAWLGSSTARYWGWWSGAGPTPRGQTSWQRARGPLPTPKCIPQIMHGLASEARQFARKTRQVQASDAEMHPRIMRALASEAHPYRHRERRKHWASCVNLVLKNAIQAVKGGRAVRRQRAPARRRPRAQGLLIWVAAPLETRRVGRDRAGVAGIAERGNVVSMRGES
jgi:hypothetical protein